MPDFTIPGVQTQNPLALLAQAGQIKAQQQQQAEAPLRMQALQQAVQSGDVGLQEKQQALNDQKAVTTAMQSWDGKNIDDLTPIVLKNGGSAQAVIGLKQHALDLKAKASTIAKDDAATGKSQVDTLKQKGDLITGALAPLVDPTQVPDAQLPQTLSATVQDLQQKGLIDQQHAQAAAALAQSGDPVAMRQGIDQFRKTYMAQSQILEQAKADQTAANQDAMRKQAAATAAETARYHDVEAKQGAQRISLEGARLNFDKARQGTQDQQSIDAQAQQIAKYEVKGLPQSRNNPYSRAVMQRVYEINPGYSDEGYATNQDFLSSKGKANAQVQSLNKLSAHLSELQQASDKAGFSPVGFTSAGKDLRLAEQLFSKEDVKFLSGSGVGTEGELNGLIDKTHSPIASVRNSAIDTLSKFTSDAARQLGDQYERGTKLKFDPTQHFTPDTVNMLNAHGGTSARSGQNDAGSPSAQPTYVTPSAKNAQGLLAPGNVDLATRPNIDNGDGTHSSVFSMGVNIGGKELLIPGVGDGKTYPLRKLSVKEAVDQYRKTGKNLGTFASPAASDAYAATLHEDQEKGNTKSGGGAAHSFFSQFGGTAK